MLDLLEDKHSQSDECGAGSSSNAWDLNQKKTLMINSHDGLSSQSSVSGGRHEQTSPQDSVSSTFKEHDYIGLNKVEVSSQNKGSAGPKNLDLNLQATELRLGPLHSEEPKSGAPFQPKSIGSHAGAEPEAKSEGLELGIGLSKQNGSTGHGQNKPSVERDMMLEKAGLQGPNQENGQLKAKGLSQSGSNQDGTVQRSSPSQWSSHMSHKQLDTGTCQASQKNHAIAGAKRVFAEAIGDGFAEGRSGFPMLSKLTGNPGGLTESELRAFSQLSKHSLLPPLYPWKTAKQSPVPHLGYMSNKVEGMPDSWESRSKASTEGIINAAENNGTQQDKGDVDDTGGGSSTRAPVGWPPVQSFRKNTLAVPQPKKQTESKGVPSVVTSAATSTQNDTTSLFVKVYMDGVSIGRKVEIKSHDSYDKLSAMLEEMFHHHINAEGAASKEVSSTDEKKLNFISGSDYVLTYEDKDGDLMLVGDVPWKLFMRTVKRLRIMKGSDAIGLGPRGSDVAS